MDGSDRGNHGTRRGGQKAREGREPNLKNSGNTDSLSVNMK